MKAEPEPPDRIAELPVLVLCPHNRCNCRCMMCDIWRIGQTRQITTSDLEPHLDSIRQLKVQWVVFSGGEPQLNRDFGKMAALLRAEGLRLTLLTAGLLLEANAESIVGAVDDIIVSVDGPAEIHNRIRGIPGAFQRLSRGITALRQHRADLEITARTTVQKANHHALRSTADAARGISADAISFLAADLTSSAFNRAEPWAAARQGQIALSEKEVATLEREIEALIRSPEMAAGFVRENEFKLRRIVRHFRAHLGLEEAEAPRCNAPWVSAVVDADGGVRPCFFHPPIGNIHKESLIRVVNSEQGIAFRRELDVKANPVCRRCVCSLNWRSQSLV